MSDLMSVVDWSRAQFALTAIYHWLFVPLTIGLAFIVAVMETIYVRTGNMAYRGITRFWMTLFGINFAIGVATGIILEFEFGTNWSNYSWFVGDIFGAPLAIEGIVAFFMEATFVGVMFFGWDRVGKTFHLVSTWLTAAGVTISALWILIANAWMQNPVGMEFDPEQMRNVMVNFAQVVFNPMATSKIPHTVFSAWTLAGVFVVGVSAILLWRKSNPQASMWSIKIGAWVGLVGIVLTVWTGDTSAVDVSNHQPMKLAAMEGLYEGHEGQSIVAVAVLNPDKKPLTPQEDEFLFHISIPKGLSLLAKHDLNAFVPGIDNLILGYGLGENGDTVWKDVSYAERIERGKVAHEALRRFETANKNNDNVAKEAALVELRANYPYFGYGFLDNPLQAVPPVKTTFYAFHIMVALGGYLLLFFIVVLFLAYKKAEQWEKSWLHWVAILTIPIVWICSEAGWITAEVGRQPWTIQDVLPTNAGISEITSTSVEITFWMFAILFTVLLVAEISIMVRQIAKSTKSDITKY